MVKTGYAMQETLGQVLALELISCEKPYTGEIKECIQQSTPAVCASYMSVIVFLHLCELSVSRLSQRYLDFLLSIEIVFLEEALH